MTAMTATLPDRSATLIHEIRAQGRAEERQIVAAAEQQAAAILASAHAEARRRVKAEIRTLRHDAERQLARARAQFETERRLRDQARAAEILHTGCPMLINVTVNRWHEPATRRQWIAQFADEALARLWPGSWTIEHPADWTKDDAAQLRAGLDKAVSPPEVNLVPSAEFEAGLRAHSHGATLDSTPERLLADKAATQARLLAEMNREAADETGGDA